MTIELFDSIALTHPLTAMREDGGGPISLAGHDPFATESTR
jgi:hypothetical protein